MRVLRSSLAGAVIVALLGGLSGVAMAQTDDEKTLDPVRAGHFTGTWGEVMAENPVPPPGPTLVKGTTGSCSEGQVSL